MTEEKEVDTEKKDDSIEENEIAIPIEEIDEIGETATDQTKGLSGDKENTEDIKINEPDISTKKSKIAIAASVIGLIAIAISALSGYFLSAKISDITNNIESIKGAIPLDKINKNAEEIKKQQNVINSIDESVDSELKNIAQKSRDALGSYLVKLESEIDEVKKGQLLVENDLGKIKRVALQKKLDWTLSEVKFLINIADHKLKFQQDIDTAIEALAAAEIKLKNLNDIGLMNLREVIRGDINLLTITKKPDIYKIADTLKELEAMVRDLPTKKPIMSELPKGNNINSEGKDPKGWDERKNRAWTTFKSSIKDYIVVRDSKQKKEPFISPQERKYLDQNIELKIQTALISLSNQDGIMFKKEIKHIEKWIRDHFDSNKTEVYNALKILAKLEAIEINPKIPSIENSIVAIEAEQAKHYQERIKERVKEDVGVNISSKVKTKVMPKVLPNTLEKKAPNAAKGEL